MSKFQLFRFNSVILPLRVSLIISDDTHALFMRVSDVSRGRACLGESLVSLLVVT